MSFVPFELTNFSLENKKALALLILLMERKSVLVRELRQMNDSIEKSTVYNDEFKQKYAWVAILLQATNQIIGPALTVFRFRSIDSKFLSSQRIKAYSPQKASIRVETRENVQEMPNMIALKCGSQKKALAFKSIKS